MLPPDTSPDLLQAALDISLTGFILFRPLYSAADPAALIDLAYEYVNPAAQRMLQLPEHPTESFLTLYPSAMETGIFAFHRDTFLSGGSGRYDVNYQADGLDNYFQLVDRRCGDQLLMNFSDTANQPRTVVEEALRESQAREQQARAEAERQRAELRGLFEQAPVALAVFRGPRHVVEMANPAVLRMWGRTPAQALHTPLFELLPEIIGQGFEELLAGVLTTGVPHVAHEMPSFIDREGRRDTVYWNFVYHPLREVDDTVAGVTVVATEVTAQVLAHQQLQQFNQALEGRVQARTQEVEATAQRLRRVTESLPSTSFTTDPSGQVLYISSQWYAYTGMVPDTNITDAWPGLIHPDDLPAVAQEFGAALAEGRAWGYEFRLRGADGQYRWFASQGVPEPLEEAEAAGRPRQWFGSNLDIDDLQRARHELEQQDWRLREILQQSPALIATTEGPDHHFAFTNPGYDALVGHRARLGASVAECLPEVVAQGFIGLLDGVYRTGEPYEGRETPVVLQPPGGVPASYYLDFTYQALRGRDGRTTGVLAFAVDVTERVRARQLAQALTDELATANRQLTRTNVDLDNFVYTASHDLKAPISNLDGLLTLLREELPVEVAQADYVAPTLAHMRDAVERFKRTIDHLTEVSKLQKEYAPTLAPVDLAAVVEGVRQDLLPLLRDTNAQLTVTVANLPAILFSEKNLRSVVYNLLSNALKYRHSDRRPHVDVRAHVRAGHTVLEVHDNGLGLEAAQLPKLFGMFQRFHTHVEGTGIGLFMVKRMVENAGGRIEVHSQLGAGTTFFVYLPQALADHVPTSVSST